MKNLRMQQYMGYTLFAFSLLYIITLSRLQDRLCTNYIMYAMIIYFIVLVAFFKISRMKR